MKKLLAIVILAAEVVAHIAYAMQAPGMPLVQANVPTLKILADYFHGRDDAPFDMQILEGHAGSEILQLKNTVGLAWLAGRSFFSGAKNGSVFCWREDEDSGMYRAVYTFPAMPDGPVSLIMTAHDPWSEHPIVAVEYEAARTIHIWQECGGKYELAPVIGEYGTLRLVKIDSVCGRDKQPFVRLLLTHEFDDGLAIVQDDVILVRDSDRIFQRSIYAHPKDHFRRRRISSVRALTSESYRCFLRINDQSIAFVPQSAPHLIYVFDVRPLLDLQRKQWKLLVALVALGAHTHDCDINEFNEMVAKNHSVFDDLPIFIKRIFSVPLLEDVDAAPSREPFSLMEPLLPKFDDPEDRDVSCCRRMFSKCSIQ